MLEADGLPREICPPLPEIPPDNALCESAGRSVLADGCYFLAYGQDIDVWYQGTLRVESRPGRLSSSGDLYAFTMDSVDEPQPIGLITPPAGGIPIFPIADYTFYLRVTEITPTDGGFLLSFEAHRYFPKDVRGLDGNLSGQWKLDGSFTARMLRADAPGECADPQMFFVGTVAGEDGSEVAQMQMGWMSPFLRRAVVEIDSVRGCEVPLSNGAGATWESVFAPVGWDVSKIVGNDNITKDDGPIWNAAAARAAMLAYRDRTDLDAEWRYHILVVSQLVAPDSKTGFMYDKAREGLMVASDHVLPDEPMWGNLRGARFGTTVAFFRTAVHEMGHAMGLDHDSTGFCFMRTTTEIARGAPPGMTFPENIEWSFAPRDQHRLRHWPDIVVRPGGASVHVAGGAPLAET